MLVEIDDGASLSVVERSGAALLASREYRILAGAHLAAHVVHARAAALLPVDGVSVRDRLGVLLLVLLLPLAAAA